MALYTLNPRGKNPNITKLLQQSCKKLKLDFKLLDPHLFDYTEKPDLGPDDSLYRICTDQASKKLERTLINKEVSTFYSDWQVCFSFLQRLKPTFLAKKEIPVPRYIPWSSENRKNLKKYVKYLGGFPVIIKVPGRQSGKGVIKSESWHNLISTIDYLRACDKDFVLKEYIDSPGTSFRSIVIGDKVVCTYKNQASGTDDFRSNSNPRKRKRTLIELDKEEKKIILRAFKTAGVEFGGVDFVYKNKKPLILELNFPCNFVPPQEEFDLDISTKMLRFLQEK